MSRIKELKVWQVGWGLFLGGEVGVVPGQEGFRPRGVGILFQGFFK